MEKTIAEMKIKMTLVGIGKSRLGLRLMGVLARIFNINFRAEFVSSLKKENKNGRTGTN